MDPMLVLFVAIKLFMIIMGCYFIWMPNKLNIRYKKPLKIDFIAGLGVFLIVWVISGIIIPL